MALALTPEVFVDLMRLCLTWEWEHAMDRVKASHNRKHPLQATQLGWTTVDKIVRILHGLEIVTKKQRSVLYKDQRLQHLVLRNTETVGGASWGLSSVLANTTRDFVLQSNPADSLNREKMLRNMHFYITSQGQTAANRILIKYASVITKERYAAEIERQEELLNRNPARVVSIMGNYHKRVTEETEGGE